MFEVTGNYRKNHACTCVVHLRTSVLREPRGLFIFIADPGFTAVGINRIYRSNETIMYIAHFMYVLTWVDFHPGWEIESLIWFVSFYGPSLNTTRPCSISIQPSETDGLIFKGNTNFLKLRSSIKKLYFLPSLFVSLVICIGHGQWHSKIKWAFLFVSTADIVHRNSMSS